MARNAGSQAQINPQQQMLMKIMPFFLPIFSVTLPAGIVLYFVVSNAYRIGQQAFITRTMYSESAKEARAAELKAKGIEVEDTKKISRKDTTPEGSRGLFGGLINLPGREDAGSNGSGKGKGKVDMTKSGARSGAKGGAARGGSGGRGGSAKGGNAARGGAAAKSGAPKGGAKGSQGKGGGGAKGPNRQAPSRSAPSAQHRSKSKKKRK